MPEGTVDVIPVDLVVAAIIDAAAGPVARRARPSCRWRRARSTRCATGTSSTWCGTCFTEHPIYDAEGQPIVVPEWSFPGRGRVQRQLERAKGAIERGERALQALPLRGKQAAWAATLEEQAGGGRAGPRLRRALRRLRRVRGDLRRRPPARPLGPRSTPRTRPRSASTRGSSTGTTTSPTSTCRRWSSTPGCAPRRADAPARSARTACAARCSTPARHFAAFDLENTLIASNVVASYSWLATRRLPPRGPAPLRAADAARGAGAARRSTGATAATSCATSTGATTAPTSPSSRPTPSRCSATSSSPSRSRPPSAGCASTARLGHRTVLITGALDFVIEPLRPLFDDIVCPVARPARPTAPTAASSPTCPPTGEARAQALFDYADAHGFDLAESRRLRRLHVRPARCSRRSASRWRSTPRPAWPPWPASGAGWSSTSTRRPGASTPPAPDRPGVGPPPQPPRRQGRHHGARPDEGAACSRGSRPSSPPRWWPGRLAPGGGAKVGPLSLRDVDPPELPGPGLGAACGPGCPASAAPTSPPSTARRRAASSRSCRSRSRPATRSSATSTTARRVVVVPVLSCVARGIDPSCGACADGRINHCERIAFGHLEPGLQCGFCEITGGGWSTLMVAHESSSSPCPTT